jgi:3-oxoacyl-[acyl-carrier-protein] synthase II
VLICSVACALSAIAIAEAASAVQCVEVDIALAGGSKAPIVPGVVMARQTLQALDGFADGEEATSCKPFAANRSGFVLGEGSAFMVLEDAMRAKARSAWPCGRPTWATAMPTAPPPRPATWSRTTPWAAHGATTCAASR